MAERSFQQKAFHVIQLFSLSLTVWILATAAGMQKYIYITLYCARIATRVASLCPLHLEKHGENLHDNTCLKEKLTSSWLL